MSQTKESKTKFENWTINLDLYCLQDDLGNELFVQPRLLKLLSVLMKNTNHVVSKTKLNQLIWDEVIVGEESLSKAVFDLRKFLNENFTNPPNIMTIRKVGYKLVYNLTRGEISIKNRTFKVLKIVFYAVVAMTLLILVLRGLRYEN